MSARLQACATVSNHQTARGTLVLATCGICSTFQADENMFSRLSHPAAEPVGEKNRIAFSLTSSQRGIVRRLLYIPIHQAFNKHRLSVAPTPLSQLDKTSQYLSHFWEGDRPFFIL